jgi:hypothetical protein
LIDSNVAESINFNVAELINPDVADIILSNWEVINHADAVILVKCGDHRHNCSILCCITWSLASTFLSNQSDFASFEQLRKKLWWLYKIIAVYIDNYNSWITAFWLFTKSFFPNRWERRNLNARSRDELFDRGSYVTFFFPRWTRSLVYLIASKFVSVMMKI